MINSDQIPLFKAAKHVLESWGIGPINQASARGDVEIPSPVDSIVSQVRFSSTSINGSLTGLVSRSQFEKIVLDMIGPDEPVDYALIKDAAGELINTITGKYLVEAFGSKIAFSLAAPRLVTPEEAALIGTPRASVPGLTEATITLIHEGAVIILSAEYLQPLS